MISLKIKLFGIITAVVVTIVALSSLATINQQNDIITGIAQRNSTILTETVKGAITDAMLSGQSNDIRRILAQISSQKLITTLRIIDESGKVLNSANPAEIGKTAFSKSLLAYKHGGAGGGTYIDSNEFISISPILNEPACSTCHDPSVKVLGLLEIETPTDYLKGFLSDTKRHTLLTSTLIILLLLVSIFFFLTIHLDRPLRSLLFSMGQVEEGNFVPSPDFTCSREMNTLSRHFNRMVTRLQTLVATAVHHEGEMVRAQEKLAHHHEISRVNRQLEQQLGEIASLNSSLEERIEEIETANRRIGAFAEKQQKDYLSTIQALVSAIEANDSYTRGHSERVRNYSLLLAGSLDLAQDRLCVLERAAILHDIGKIGINWQILNKREELTSAEIMHLRQHPDIGMRILEPIEFLDDVRTCIGQHHEWFDGSGYPNRHNGESLLIESRILAIADAFDAMTSNRPYRRAKSIADAVQELCANAGSQFDPDLVHRFIGELSTAGILNPSVTLYDTPAPLPLTA